MYMCKYTTYTRLCGYMYSIWQDCSLSVNEVLSVILIHTIQLFNRFTCGISQQSLSWLAISSSEQQSE